MKCYHFVPMFSVAPAFNNTSLQLCSFINLVVEMMTMSMMVIVMTKVQPMVSPMP